MKSTARLGEHPIHPMLIPYPFAFLSGALGFRLAAHARGSDALAQTADHLRTVGLASAVIAAVPGVVDYFGSVPDGRPKRTATQHALSNSGALICFAAAALAARRGQPARDAVLRFESVGTAFLCIGGWLGGQLAYHHRIGVVEDEPLGREAKRAGDRRSEDVEAIQNVGP